VCFLLLLVTLLGEPPDLSYRKRARVMGRNNFAIRIFNNVNGKCNRVFL
jgi:hypothetical protein